MIFEHKVTKHYLCSKLEEPPPSPRRQVLCNGSSNTCFLQPNLDGERSKLIIELWIGRGRRGEIFSSNRHGIIGKYDRKDLGEVYKRNLYAV
jgi:hypothetical protein